MSVPQLVKQIHLLTYKEMLQVAGAIQKALQEQDALDKGLPQTAIAEALLLVEGATDIMAQEETLLRQLFSRKRSISVERDGKGWLVDITTIPGAQAAGVSLREALSRSLDQIVTLQALQK